MDSGTFESFIDAIDKRYSENSDVTVIHEEGGVGDTVRLVVTADTRDSARDVAGQTAETVRCDYNGRARVVTVYGRNDEEFYAAEILAVPEHGE